MGWTTRIASPDDAEQVADVLREGFESYRSFAPRSWEPPVANLELEALRARLTDPAVWCMVAQADGGETVGVVSLLPASAHARWPTSEPGLAQLWLLFLRERWWGSGLAPELHREVVREARARGYRSMRLFTPAAQARARRFYEREGWTLARASVDAPEFGLQLAELRLAISSSV